MIVTSDRTIYDILQESDKLCEEGFSLHFLDEVPAQNTGLVFAKGSDYTEAFSVISAERLEESSPGLHRQRSFAF